MALAKSLWFCLLVAFACSLAGCLERDESITINPDGSAVLKSVFKGDVDDLGAGDAIPSPGGPWMIHDELANDDQKKITRTAEITVAFGAVIPGAYLPTANDPRADRVLNFPTTVRITAAAADDKDVAHTNYDFKRTYQRRDDARYTLTQRLLDKDEAFKAIKAKPQQELTGEDRVAVVKALTRIELNKYQQYGDAGIAAVGSGWTQETGMLVRQTLADYVNAFDPRPFADLLGQPQNEERDQRIAAAARTFRDELRQAVMTKMDAMGLSKESQARFIAAAETETDRRAVTEDLADEKWEVRVTLPGTIAAHNGDRVEGSTVIWNFTGEYLMDRDQTLMASSRVDAQR
jgi:hypothetical protein